MTLDAERPASEPPRPPLVGPRRLIGTSFDLILRSADQVRPASFYIGLIVLGTVGPMVLALLGLAITGLFDPLLDVIFDPTFDPTVDPVPSIALAGSGWFVVLALVAVAGIVVASIEAQAMAIAVLGARFVERTIPTRDAVRRSRQTFWRVFGVVIAIGIPTSILQDLIQGAFGAAVETGLVVALAITTAIQAPFIYAPSGVVLGDVGAVEALRRSVPVFRARPGAGVLVTIIPVLFQFVLAFGLTAGLDVIVRIVDVLGLGPESGAAGTAALAVLSIMAVFSLGTLVFTVAALAAAPQVVMFVGLTHATPGLDRVRPGDPWAPSRPDDGRPFRWITRPMLVAFAIGAVALAALLAEIGG